MKLYYRLLGYRRVSFSQNDAAEVLNICMKYGYPYRDMSNDGDTVSFTCTLHTASSLFHRAEQRSVCLELSEIRGVPSLLFRLAQHPGFVTGFVIACLAFVLSGNFVWDIRVSGNEMFTDEEIEGILERNGFSVGSPLASFNADRTELETLIDCRELAWISVNVNGSVAYVEVREKIPTEPQLIEGKAANIVASQSGTVTEIVAYNGIPAVKAGDNVRRGELLISGVYGEKAPGIRVTRAAGYVLARTVRSFSVEIPYVYEEKEYTGDEKREIFLFFFKNPIKVFGNSGNLGASCDKIEEVKNFYLFGDRLPFSVNVNRYAFYNTVSKEFSPDEARERAKSELDALVKSSLDGAEIIARRDSFTVGEDSVILECEIVCIENIALISEFEIKYN